MTAVNNWDEKWENLPFNKEPPPNTGRKVFFF